MTKNNTPQKHAIVTGASRGIGLEIAKKLLKEGFRVTGTARKSEFPNELSSHKNFNGIHVDLGSKNDIEFQLKPLFSKSGGIDVLINNAGISVDMDFSDDDKKWLEVWDRTLDVNLRSTALLSKWFVNIHTDHQSKGVLINIASRAAYRGDTQEFAAYAASKAGMVAFTKSIARNFSKMGISAYSIAPGFIDTDMALEAVSVYGEEYLTQGSAFDEITDPKEVANLVAFLSKGDVPHMSGQTFHINGGSYMI
ncbi:SDR family NAD(P)-dependent oxidoreductase [Rhodohalobacter sp. 614A]|uniref:SDR family NAD(P)-dependent oxidoreductase n=1 Tax=Rhodohalobacter sp. 614A TaxID=2908649 RepID=UPI001F1E8C2F|nr:SDR family oxidoreductase [Rhodohalobacter sp. 614A]